MLKAIPYTEREKEIYQAGMERGKNETLDKFVREIQKDARYVHPVDVIEVNRCIFIAKQIKENDK